MNKQDLAAELTRNEKTYADMAKALEISEMSFYRKINGLNEFKLSEIQLISQILKLDDKTVKRIFFTP